MTVASLPVAAPDDLGPAELLACARGAAPRLAPDLVAALGRRRSEVLDALLGDHPVYGVTTGMGALTGVRLDAAGQGEQSRRLLVGRAVGGPPWLAREEARAVVAVRLRTFLSGDAGVSPELCAWLVTLLEDDLVPAVPRSGSGAAGEIIPLAHAWGHLAGVGQLLDVDGSARDAGPLLASYTPPRLGAKEGVALLQGVPVATALSLLRAAEAAVLLRQWLRVAAAEIVLVGASRDPVPRRHRAGRRRPGSPARLAPCPPGRAGRGAAPAAGARLVPRGGSGAGPPGAQHRHPRGRGAVGRSPA